MSEAVRLNPVPVTPAICGLHVREHEHAGAPVSILIEYARHLERCGLAAGTVERKLSSLRLVERELGPLLELRHAALEQFLDDRMGRDGGRLDSRTRFSWISTLHVFYTWALTFGHAEHDPTSRLVRPKLRRLLPRPIREDDYRLAVALAPTRMMRLWMLLGGHAGLRCKEIAELTGDAMSLHSSNPHLRILGKGGRERIVPLHRRLVAELDTWTGEGPLFRHSATGEPFTPEQVSVLGGRYLRSIGVRASMHQLRHRFASILYAETGDIAVVGELLGHSNLETTRIYALVSDPRKRRAIDSIE